jgi:hypothetical protein
MSWLLLFELSQYESDRRPSVSLCALDASANGALVFPVLSVPGKLARGLLALSDLKSWTQDRRVSTISISSRGDFSFSAGSDVPALISRTFIVLLPFPATAFQKVGYADSVGGPGISAIVL